MKGYDRGPILPAAEHRVATCQWPEGDVGTPGFHFCGAPVETPGRSYCDAHHRVAYIPAGAAAAAANAEGAAPPAGGFAYGKKEGAGNG